MSKEKYAELVELVERCMHFEKWGFKLSYSSSTDIPFPYVIYNSEWCRVKFLHFGGDYPGQWREMKITYGRFHADNEESFMIWNDEVCWCWHHIHVYSLNFLDGLSPEEAVEHKYKPQVMHEFRESEISKTVRGPEWVAKNHLTTWEYYGQRLFELFDLRRPDLWDEYRTFLTKVKALEDENDKKREIPRTKFPGHPEIDEVC